MVLNTILAKIGDFLGRKFKFISDKFADIITNVIPQAKQEAIDASKTYTDNKCTVTLNESKAYTNTQITNLINGAPEALDTLKELADAIGKNGDIITVINNTLNGIGTYEEFVAAFNDQVGKDSIFYEKTA